MLIARNRVFRHCRPMHEIDLIAPAKINLALHVTGQRADGYHLLDSLVGFASFGDRITLRRASDISLKVTGPFASGVPEDARNLCWQAALAFGEAVAITLDKHLPHPAGIGGGSSDAAAVLRGMERLFGRAMQGDMLRLGADLPVCYHARAARMQGVGESVTAANLPPMKAVLVNPKVDLPTPKVFAALTHKSGTPMSQIPQQASLFWPWLKGQRNDLQAPAIRLAPVISQVLQSLNGCGANLVRMSGSGATCFALFGPDDHAEEVARDLSKAHPEWWVQACSLV